MRAVCIDDEYLILDYMDRQLRKIEGVAVIGSFTNPLEAEEFVLTNSVDVVFLDIQMSPINGVELAEQLLHKKPELQIIFVTAHESFAVQAFELNAIDYLVKPVRAERLKRTVGRIKDKIASDEKTSPIKPDILRIKVASFLSFEVGEGAYEVPEWRTAKAKELFIYLLQNHNVIVEKSAIIDLFWGEYEVDRAYSLLYTTIYNIRKQLKEYNEFIILHNHSHGYLLELRDVEVDLFCWEDAVEVLGELSAENYADYEKLLPGYRGDYLSDYDYPWLEAERERLKKIWVHHASQLASFYEKAGKPAEAVRWYNDIADRYPEREETHFSLMKLYEANGDFTAMMKQYNLLYHNCRKYLDDKPHQSIIDWYVSKIS